MSEQVFSQRGYNFLWDGILPVIAEHSRTLSTPGIKMCIHPSSESYKFWMLIDCGFNGCLVHCKVKITKAVLFEQGLPKLWTDVPVLL